MRLFIAIPFSEEFKGELIRVQNEMKVNGVRGNFSHPENLHVTVAFLGEVKDPAPAMKALASVPVPELRLTSGPLGNFGELLWIGLRKNSALEEYVAEVRHALDNAGVEYSGTRWTTPGWSMTGRSSGRTSRWCAGQTGRTRCWWRNSRKYIASA